VTVSVPPLRERQEQMTLRDRRRVVCGSARKAGSRLFFSISDLEYNSLTCCLIR